MKTKAKVGILTSFTGSDFGYSLIGVVHVQLQMLHKANYSPVLFVCPSFTGTGVFSDSVTTIRRTIAPDALADDIANTLRTMITDIDVMICHDLLFLAQHKEWGNAIRKLAVEFPHIAWLHWQHSRGDHSPIEKMDNSYFCYPNMGDLGHVARINNTDMGHVRYIPHPLDISYMRWTDLAVRIAEDYEFPFVDVSMIYPARLDKQKQVEKLVRLFAGIKSANRSVCLLVADAFATGDRFLAYKQECNTLAKELGLTNKEFAFLGEHYDECKISTQRETVKSLLEMSNIFIQPSTAETSSLVCLEASLAGNLLVLNADFPPIHHLYQKALTLPFGSIFENTKYYRDVHTADGKVTKVLDPQLFWNERAKDTILPALDSQIVLTVKRQQLKERWPSKVFLGFMEPLIEKAWSEVRVSESQFIHGDPDVTAIITVIDNLKMLERAVPICIEECGRVIVVDQDSKDGTKEWLDGWGNLITVIHRQNNGAGPGRNSGLAEWDKHPTPYTLMLDGGVLPFRGGVKLLKDYLVRNPDVHVISPEVASCLTDDESQATLVVPENTAINQAFPQSALSSTAYCLCRADAWKVRFSEEGPYAEAGWGVDDNDLAHRWANAGVLHHDFTFSAVGLKFLRSQGNWRQRLFDETGIWPNQYGSVYEKRCVKCAQDWPQYFDPIWHKGLGPDISFVIEGIDVPELSRVIKRLHDDNAAVPHEVIVKLHGLSQDSIDWLESVRYRWPWGDVAFDKNGKKIVRNVDCPEELWTGNVLLDVEPRGKTVFNTLPENIYVSMANA